MKHSALCAVQQGEPCDCGAASNHATIALTKYAGRAATMGFEGVFSLAVIEQLKRIADALEAQNALARENLEILKSNVNLLSD